MNDLEQNIIELIELPRDTVTIRKIRTMSKELLELKIKSGAASNEEKVAYIGEQMEIAFYEKTGETRDSIAAEYAYKRILGLDGQNPEAHYRYAYLLYAKKQWLNAIEHFQKAIHVNKRDESNFPLADDQIIKAKLFIGYCAAQIAKESLKEANKLSSEAFDLAYEGISIRDLSSQLKAQLKKTELSLVTPIGTEEIPQEKYRELTNTLAEDTLLLSFVESQPFIQKGDDAKNPVSGQEGILIKRLLLKCIQGKPLSLAELNGYVSEEETMNEVIWDAYRKQVSRLNKLLKDSGYKENPIVVDAGCQRYRIHVDNFYIVAREDQYL